MKKSIFTLVFGILLSLSAAAQVDLTEKAEKLAARDIETTETVTKLTKKEKKTYSKLLTEHYLRHWDIVDKYKATDPDKFKESVQNNGKYFAQLTIDAFGNKRGVEILKARQPK